MTAPVRTASRASTAFGRIGSALSMFGAAVSVSGSVRRRQTPNPDALRTLGIDPANFPPQRG